MFCSALFNIAIPHKLELTGPMRGASVNSSLVEALRELRLGHCSEVSFFSIHLANQLKVTQCAHLFQETICSTTQLISSLSNARRAVYFQQQRWRQYIRNKLSCWSVLSHQTIDQDNDHLEHFWYPDKLHFGTIFGNERWVVRGQSSIILKRETWLKCNRSGKVVGSRTQFPVALFYASPCHKA